MKRLLWTYLEAYGSAALGLVAYVIIGRLLTPDEIGVHTTAAVLVGFLTVVRDFGTTSYLIQTRELGPERLKGAVRLANTVAFAATGVLVAIAYPASRFYDDQRIAVLLLCFAVNIALLPASAIRVALLRRELRLKEVLYVNLGTSAISALASVALALLGAGYLSLVLANVLSTMIGVLIARHLYKLRLPRHVGREHVREAVGIGSWVTGASLARDVRISSSELVLGRTLGMDAVGYYAKAGSPMWLFWQGMMVGIYSYALPYLSDRLRSGAGLGESFVRIIERLSGAALPLLAVLAVESGALVLILNGDNWGVSAEMAWIFVVAALVQFPASILTNAVMVASGAVRTYFTMHVILLVVKAIALTQVMTRPLFEFVLIVVGVETLAELVAGYFVLYRVARVTPWRLFRSCASGYVIAAMMAGAAIVLSHSLQGLGLRPFPRLLAEAPAFGLLWLLLIWSVGHPLMDDIRIVRRRVAELILGRS